MERDKTKISPKQAIKKSRRYIELSAARIFSQSLRRFAPAPFTQGSLFKERACGFRYQKKLAFSFCRIVFSPVAALCPRAYAFCGTLAQVRGGLQRRTRSPPLLTFGTFGHAKVHPFSPGGNKSINEQSLRFAFAQHLPLHKGG